METMTMTNPYEGHSADEAARLLAQYGFNELAEKKQNPLLDFLGRFWGPMPWLLETAMVLSIVLGHTIEAVMILVILSINAVIGFRHARESRQAVELLRKRLALTVRVLRDGSWTTIPARETVPGDIISVRLGEIIPADARVITGNLSVDQSSLTGESLPAEVGPGDTIYSGSPVRRGEARCVVTATGNETYFGKTARLVETAKHASHQEEVMLGIVRYMMHLGIAASIVVAAYAWYVKVDPIVILSFMVIFLMGAVPVALPAVLAIVQSVGAIELSKKGAVVSRLEAIEDAASIDTLCFDKTGTITENKLAVAEMQTFGETGEEDLLRLAVLASSPEGNDLIDSAIAGEFATRNVQLNGYEQTHYTPFDPALKRTESIAEKSGTRIRIVKGAPTTVFRLCGEGISFVNEAAKNVVLEYSKWGYRSIAVAFADGEKSPLRMAGLIALSDPPRKESSLMMEKIKALGIRPFMLTGDDVAIGGEIAKTVGIGGRILDRGALDGLDEQKLAKTIADANGVAGIYPEDKYNIVRALQSDRHMVGMTGDGINDAPALRQAEMGIAVDNAADVAKAAAGIVLTEPGLGVIVHAIETSRQIYQRMLSWVFNKIIKVISFVGLLTASFFWLRDLPLTMLGMSLLVFANDFATMSLAKDNVSHTPKPNQWEVGAITLASIIPGICFMLQGLGALAIGKFALNLGMDELKTVLLLNLVFSSQFRVLIVRERGHFWNSKPGAALLVTSALMIGLFLAFGTFGILMSRISMPIAACVLFYSAIASLAADFPKVWSFRLFGFR
jgi:H+-transporting ATPase